jgi:hypothetical protein
VFAFGLGFSFLLLCYYKLAKSRTWHCAAVRFLAHLPTCGFQETGEFTWSQVWDVEMAKGVSGAITLGCFLFLKLLHSVGVWISVYYRR